MNIFQTTLQPKVNTTYGKPQYNYVKGKRQRTELHRGCPWGHEYCYEPKIDEDFPIPAIVRNYVEILDMNVLRRKDILQVINQLADIRVKGKVVTYEAALPLRLPAPNSGNCFSLETGKICKATYGLGRPFFRTAQDEGRDRKTC